MKPRCRLWISTPTGGSAFGEGKWRLLKAIDERGSLRAAAASLEISYRKAWGDLKKAEADLGITLIDKSRGGKSGGTTQLTENGRKWLSAFTKFREEINATVDTKYDKHIKPLTET